MTLVSELEEILGRGHVLTDAATRASYESDWTGRYRGSTEAVVRPKTTSEVAAILQACGRHGVAVVPQGGNTGLVGGAVPTNGAVVLSLKRMTYLAEPDTTTGTIEAGAGVTLADLQRAAADAGWDAALDLGARDSATLGGIIACDAGGARALRHGTARARVAGLEAVLADGTELRRNGSPQKDNAGLDLSALIIGSEGTLAVITRVVWHLVPHLSRRVAALVPCDSVEASVALLGALRRLAPSLEACDFMADAGMQLVLGQRRTAPVRRAPLYVIVELAARHDPMDELAEAFEAVGISEAAIADDTGSRARLWSLREEHTEAIAALGIPHKIDVGVPPSALARFLHEVPGVVGAIAASAQTILFGHLGDGNIHVNVLGAEPGDRRIDDAVLRLALDCGGTISAEHGVGRAKVGWLTAARGAGDVRAAALIKRALDPASTLNPGILVASQSARAPSSRRPPHDMSTQGGC